MDILIFYELLKMNAAKYCRFPLHSYSSSSCSCMSTSSAPSSDNEFNISWEAFEPLYYIAPAFRQPADDIEFLYSPDNFYNFLINGIQNSKNRIVISSLYIGTGPLELQLLKTLEERLALASLQNESNFKVTILLDGLRGKRGPKSSESLLHHLVKKYSIYLEVCFFEAPSFTKTFFQRYSLWLPVRWRESFGFLQHTKIYVFDSLVLLSGANLSETYFKNRLDRYVIFKNNRRLIDYFDSLVYLFIKISACTSMAEAQNYLDEFMVRKFPPAAFSDSFKSSEKVPHSLSNRNSSSSNPSILTNGRKNDPKSLFKSLIQTELNDTETLILPSIQIPFLNVIQDECLTSSLLYLCKTYFFPVQLATAYFNPTEPYIRLLSQFRYQNQGSSLSIYTAGPSANGFWESKGVSKYIPSSYYYLLESFCRKFNYYVSNQLRPYGSIKNSLENKNEKQKDHPMVFEWEQPNWTFHTKGLWACPSSQSSEPFITCIGSSNYGYRSVYRDMESQLTIITKHPLIRDQMKREIINITNYCQRYDPSRHKMPFWIPWVTNKIKSFL